MKTSNLEIQSEVLDSFNYCCTGAEANSMNYLVESHGVLVCRFCGLQHENIYVMGLGVQENCGMRHRKTSRPVFDKYAIRTDFNPKKANNSVHYAGLRKKNVWSNPHKTIYKRKIDLVHKCAAMNLKQKDIQDMAWQILLTCLEQRLTVKTRCTLDGLILTSIYFACRIQRYDIFMSDVIGKTRVERKKNAGFVTAYPHVLRVVKTMGYKDCLNRNQFIIEDIFKVGSNMDLEMCVIQNAETMMKQASDSLNMLGKRRVPYAAACLFLAASVGNVEIDIKKLAEKAGTSPVTINSRCGQIASILGVEIKKGKGRQPQQYYSPIYQAVTV